MTMQILEAGGLDLKATRRLRDNPDDHHDYCEDNEANNDTTRLRQATGRTVAVKVWPRSVILALRKAIIPAAVIVPIRDPDESRASWARRFPDRTWHEGHPGSAAPENVTLERAVRLLGQAHVPTLPVYFHDTIDRPRETAVRIAAFLAPWCSLDVDAMAAVPDPAMRHFHTHA